MSSIRGTFKLTNPDNVEATMTITMTIERWRTLRDLVKAGRGSPAWQVEVLIDELLAKATAAYAEQTEKLT